MKGRIPSGDVQLAVCNGRNIYVMVYQQSLRRNFKSKAFYVMNNIHVDVLLPLIMSNCCNGSCWIIGSGANADWELSWITSHFGRTVEVMFWKNVNQSLRFQIVCSDYFVRLVAAWARTCGAEHLCHCLCVDGYSAHCHFLSYTTVIEDHRLLPNIGLLPSQFDCHGKDVQG